jgi:hypothetical protein
MSLLIGMVIFVLIMMVAQVVWYLVRYLALHKIFSQYSTGQRPVFYLILSMFVPMAGSILLFMHSKRPLLDTGVVKPVPVMDANPAVVAEVNLPINSVPTDQ